MRALLVVNPKATTTSERSRNVLVRALRTEMDIRFGDTRRRGHAAELARQAVRDRLDVVVALGGDGTVNEVINGLLTATPRVPTKYAARSAGSTTTTLVGAGDEPEGRGLTAADLPVLAVVPGGSTNVFARALGLPNDAIEATGALLEALHAQRTRTIGLGRADGRFFTFCAGFGLDAEVVRAVERARLRGKIPTPALYIRSAVTQFLVETDRRAPAITLEVPGQPPEGGLGTVIVQNTTPWTYLGNKAISPCPDAGFDTGLDLMAVRALNVHGTALVATNLLTGRLSNLHARHTLTHHDLSGFVLTASRPTAFQIDGEYLGERTNVTFTAVPDALRVFC
ncbi:MAG: diacylglycerol kinase family lipid kinase [Micromonosporaceae bacterium]|nr:diacylglycerol kinase family lipid kinase [Micromonosporaceae bacterium]